VIVLHVLGLLLRVPAATTLMLLGLGKLARLPEGALAMWRPKWVGGWQFVIAVSVVALLEVATGIAVLVAHPNGLGMSIAATTVALLVVLTAYGVTSVRRTGSCGCSGDRGRARTVRSLLVRNAFLAATGAVSITLGGWDDAAALRIATVVIVVATAVVVVAVLLRLDRATDLLLKRYASARGVSVVGTAAIEPVATPGLDSARNATAV
jgi:methylamine utilization protein MauE